MDLNIRKERIMSIFDVFSFKKEGAKVFSIENFQFILMTVKEEILKQAKEQIAGAEKKKIVDNIVIAKINVLKETYPKNKLILWILDRVIDAVPAITQLIYEFLKEKIENL